MMPSRVINFGRGKVSGVFPHNPYYVTTMMDLAGLIVAVYNAEKEDVQST
jgi:hypothetical protein